MNEKYCLPLTYQRISFGVHSTDYVLNVVQTFGTVIRAVFWVPIL